MCFIPRPVKGVKSIMCVVMHVASEVTANPIHHAVYDAHSIQHDCEFNPSCCQGCAQHLAGRDAVLHAASDVTANPIHSCSRMYAASEATPNPVWHIASDNCQSNARMFHDAGGIEADS